MSFLKITLHVVQAIFVILGSSVFSSFVRNGNIKLLMASIIYLCAAGLSYSFVSWWPLLVGYIMVWFLRFLRFDSDYRQVS